MEDKEHVQYPELAEEIAQMVKEDQAFRDRLISEERTPKLLSELQKIDSKNTKKMKKIIEEHGWPSRSKVGKDGSEGAWLLVQHADRDVAFQERCLEMMKALPEGEVEKRNIAYLEDRVRVNTGQPQLFGTQFYLDENGKYGPRPIEDPEHVNERRFSVGLGTIKDYEKNLRRDYKIK